MDNSNRYMMRGVSAAKEDVHNAIKNMNKGIFPTFSAATPNIATSCMLTAQEQNRRWLTCIGKRQAT